MKVLWKYDAKSLYLWRRDNLGTKRSVMLTPILSWYYEKDKVHVRLANKVKVALTEQEFANRLVRGKYTFCASVNGVEFDTPCVGYLKEKGEK